MPHMAIYDMEGAKAGDIEVPAEVFGVPYNPDLVQQAVTVVDWQRKRHCGKTKGRGEVSITTAKWYRQKGTGRARHGDQSPPNFVGGGVAHGPRGVSRRVTMPKKMRRKATYCALSVRARQGAVTLVDKIALDRISTRRFTQVLDDLGVEGRVLMLLGSDEARDEVLFKSCRNVPNLVAREAPHFNARDVMWAEEILMTRAALQQVAGGEAADAE